MSRICVPVCARSIDEMHAAVECAAELGDLVELRLDCLPDLEAALRMLDHATSFTRPLIITMRKPEQGGQSSVDDDGRRHFWSSLKAPATNCLFDLEYDLVLELSSAAGLLPLDADWSRVICSHHDFQGVPSDLDQIFESMMATPAGISKIAVRANDAVDCLPIFKLIERAQREHRQLIAIAMGPAGIMTRVLGPSRGGFLTYGALDDEKATAPGQVTASDLRDVYRIDRIDGDTQIFGIIGNRVSHSLSPAIHNAAFAANEMNAVYIPFEVHDAPEFVRRMVHPKTRELDWNLKGLSVTAPHKSTVMAELDWIDPACREIGACNTVVVRGDQLFGYNTDAAGFIAPLREVLVTIRDARCAVVGAGGAARACVWALKQEGADVTVFARDESTAEVLANTFGVQRQKFPVTSFEGFDVVINTTPLGTRGEREHESIATAEQLRRVRLAYDLVYNPSETRFLREARSAGCEVLSGMEMLLAQAVEQSKLWTGRLPDANVMRERALRRFTYLTDLV
jgi:3-dehydroquinate dehydratase/shikimate dehydrogenase